MSPPSLRLATSPRRISSSPTRNNAAPPRQTPTSTCQSKTPSLRPSSLAAFRKGGAFSHPKYPINLLAVHNTRKGAFLFDPVARTEGDFRRWARASFAGLTEAEVERLAGTVYPAVYDGSQGYGDLWERVMVVYGEALFDCNFLGAGEGFGGRGFAYEFGSPGLHTQDLKYTFNDPAGPAFNPGMQEVLQMALATFVVSGTPVLKGRGKGKGKGDAWPKWGDRQQLVNITASGPEVGVSNVNKASCQWWAEGKLGRYVVGLKDGS